MRALDAARRWVGPEAEDRAVLRFRQVFALIWLIHDVCDLLLQGTARQHLPFASGRPPLLTVMQVGLIVSQLGMLLGRPSAARFTLLALLLRICQSTLYPLNDFFYFSVVAALLAVPGNPRWRWDVLIWQTGWIYLATGLLKLNDEWLSGGHLFARFGYLWQAQGWPHPRALEACIASLSCTSVMAAGAVLAELGLGLLLWLRPRGARPLVIGLAIGVHTFAAVALNVWFFGASMIAQVALLYPRPATPTRAADPAT